MRVGWGFLLWGSIFIFSISAVAAEKRDNHDCALWMEYFALQEQVFSLAQRNLPVPSSLRNQMAELSEVLNSEESGATEATSFNINEVGFEPYLPWSPEGETSEQEAEAAAREEEEADRESESEYWSFDQKLARLEALLEQRGEKVNSSAIQAIFPRMLATRAYGNQHYRVVMQLGGLDDPTLQVFSLALWAHHANPRHPALPDEKELLAIAAVLATPLETAQDWIALDRKNRPAKVVEILEAVGDELDLSVEKTLIRLNKFQAQDSRSSPPNLGRLLYNFLGANDYLFPIHDSESLDRFLSRE